MAALLLGGIGEGGDLDAADLALVELLVLDAVGMDVGLLGGGGILDVGGQLDALVVVALVAVLSDLAVGLGIEVFRFDCGDVSHIAGHVRVDGVDGGLLLFCGFISGGVAHVADNWGLLCFDVDHASTTVSYKYLPATK